MIRVASNKDVTEINKLGSNLHENFVSTFHIETEIDSELAIVLVSENPDYVDGYLYALDFGDNIDLLSIYVAEEKRNNHIGTKLLTYLINNYCYQDNKTITLEVSCANIPAYEMYKKLNFKIVGKRSKYYGTEDAYIMKWGNNEWKISIF